MNRAACSIACVLVACSAWAQTHAPLHVNGAGIIVGEPTGLSFKHWMSRERAVDAAAAWSFSENDSFQSEFDLNAAIGARFYFN